jgi:formyltetrahydrofolate deformylase
MSSPHTVDTPTVQVLLVDCPDQRGLIHAITGVLRDHGANILANDEFVDRDTSRFFMRSELVDATGAAAIVAELERLLPAPATVRLSPRAPRRIVILGTREPHCVGDLLLRWSVGALNASVEAVVGNTAELAPLAERFGVPFHHVPQDDLTRDEHERRLAQVLGRHTFDYLVLAKYMRILSPSFLAGHRDRIINIHHSFLPAFVGAHAYRKAFERGVKIIGATAHFVTEALDEGPIIAQATTPVDHSYRPQEMARAGQEIEKAVLARALEHVFDDRVFVHGNRTIVFD